MSEENRMSVLKVTLEIISSFDAYKIKKTSDSWDHDCDWGIFIKTQC